MKLPEKVLIDDIEYKVEEVSHKELIGMKDLKGEYWGDTRYGKLVSVYVKVWLRMRPKSL